MIFVDAAGHSDEFPAYRHLEAYDSEEVISIPMSGYGKQPHYDVLGMGYVSGTLGHDSDVVYQHTPNSYDSVSNHHGLNAMASGPAFEFFEDGDFSHTYEYPPRVPSAASNHCQTVVPTTKEWSTALQPVSAGQQPSRKRKASEDHFDQTHPPKKTLVTQVHIQDPNGEFYDLSEQTSPYSSLVPTPAAVSTFNQPPSIGGSPRVLGHQHSVSNASHVSIAAPSPYTPAISPSFTNANTEHSPRAPTTPAPQQSASTSPYSGRNPKLVRTSTIAQQMSPALGPVMAPTMHSHAFNPYAIYPPNTKATLRLRGDLDAVAKKWSADELQHRRKLVVFTRSQSGSVIDADFRVVSEDAWSRSDVTVNCIWWKEKNEAYVTSVDTIALLEQLVAVRFTVEEKNRIRRNLEGFRPLTVSKAKSDSEDFFKVIMGFPNPKPRNIEKDVKVFPWKILSTALKKIISKYSASYSSTASTLASAPGPAYGPVDLPADFHYSASPAPDYAPSMNHAYMPPAYEPGMVGGRASAPPATVPNLQLHVPTAASTYESNSHYGYVPAQYMPAQVTYSQQALSAPAAQAPHSWNFNHVPSSEAAGPMAPASAPPTAYPQHFVDHLGYPMTTVYHR